MQYIYHKSDVLSTAFPDFGRLLFYFAKKIRLLSADGHKFIILLDNIRKFQPDYLSERVG